MLFSGTPIIRCKILIFVFFCFLILIFFYFGETFFTILFLKQCIELFRTYFKFSSILGLWISFFFYLEFLIFFHRYNIFSYLSGDILVAYYSLLSSAWCINSIWSYFLFFVFKPQTIYIFRDFSWISGSPWLPKIYI